MEAIINTGLRVSVCLHGFLHEFHTGRLIDTSILKMKVDQDLSRTNQDLLFLVFLDLRKAYETVDCERLLTTLEGYGAGPCTCILLAVF